MNVLRLLQKSALEYLQNFKSSTEDLIGRLINFLTTINVDEI